jgi:tetratricopeptide (TPR) repeat protein
VPLTILNPSGVAADFLAETGGQLRVQSGLSRLDYLFTQFRVIITYLRLLVLPLNQNLDYDYPAYTSFFTPSVFLSFLLLVALFTLAIYLFYISRVPDVGSRTAAAPALRLIAFGIFWFFLTLAVESSLIPIEDLIMEHRLYLPGFGAATVFATGFYLLAERCSRFGSSRLLILAMALIVLVLGFATWQRNNVWGNAIRLWKDGVAKSPHKGRVINNLGVALEAVGRRPEAFKTLSQAIAVDPDYYRSYYNLADLYLVSDQPDVALPLLQTAIKLRPDFTEAYVSIGAALMRGGRFRELTIFLEKNLDRIRGEAEAHFYLGAGYVFLGDRQAALRELEIVSKLDKSYAANLAGMLGLKSNKGGEHGHE